MARPRPGPDPDTQRLLERDLTALAQAGKLPAAYGADPLVGEVLALLSRGAKHPLLAGDAGVGKTAIVQEVARRLSMSGAGGDLAGASGELAGGRVVEISIAGILARGERKAAESLDELLDSLAETPRTIVYVRDLAVGLGGPCMPVMVRALRSGALRFILEADPRKATELTKSDEALAERVHLLTVAEPSTERVRWMLGQVADELESQLGMPIDPQACDLVLRLSTKFLLSQRMPRKAIELLRETAAEAAGANKDRVGPDDVLSRFSAATRLPRPLVDDAAPLDLAETQRFFGERILGQPDAVSVVLRSVALLKAGLNDPRRPLGVFLFAGPTGVGKTQLAKLLAEYLFGAADRLVRLNMADYPDENDEAIVFGSPWGQTYEAQRGELSRLLDGKVFAVLLLDEFEKAYRGVHDRFLQLFDEGRFVNAAGETVPCNNVVIVATSNVGAEAYREPPLGFAASRAPHEVIAEVDRRIAETFRPEFLNRFDAVCHFQPLSRVEIRKIAHREVGRVLEREGIRARGLDVEVAPEVVDVLVERGYSPHFGARFLQREIEKTLTAALAVEIVKKPLPAGTFVRVETRPGGKVMAVAQPKPTREATAQLTLPTTGAAEVRRRLDRRSLLTESESLLARATRLGTEAGRPELEKRRAELLARSQAPDFWDDPEAAAALLRDYRALDAQITDLDRVARACNFARRLVRDAKGEQHLASAAKAVEEVAREVKLLEARAAAGASADVDDALLELEGASDGEPARAFLRELGFMYLAWAERRGYEAAAYAEGQQPQRVIVRITGPGVLGFLAGEAGLHRRIDDQRKLAAYVRLRRWPSETPFGDAHESQSREIRRRPGFFVERLASEAVARDSSTGRSVTLWGVGDAQQLRRVSQALLEVPALPPGEVRRYHVGRAARVEDPRTGVSTPRIKDVLRGELEVFIAGWMSREEPAGSSSG